MLAAPFFMTAEEVTAETIRRINSPRRSDATPFFRMPKGWNWNHAHPTLYLWLAVLSICNREKYHLVRKFVYRAANLERRAKVKVKNASLRQYRKERREIRRRDPAYAELERQRNKDDFQKHKPRIYAYRKRRRKSDPQYQISSNLRTYIYQHVGEKTQRGESRFRKLVGCSVAELQAHLEWQFLPGMTWGNYGRGMGKWNMDHIRPCASFDMTDQQQVLECFNWRNLRPLWWQDNLAKSDKFVLHSGF